MTILAAGRVYQELVAAGRRTRTDVAVQAGDAFDVHDVAMLLAVGASAIHPGLLLELAAEQAGRRGAEGLSAGADDGERHRCVEQGLHKVLARMGISTLASYRGGQIVDVLSLDDWLVSRCFPASNHWPGSVGPAEIGTRPAPEPRSITTTRWTPRRAAARACRPSRSRASGRPRGPTRRRPGGIEGGSPVAHAMPPSYRRKPWMQDARAELRPTWEGEVAVAERPRPRIAEHSARSPSRPMLIEDD